MRTLVAMRTRAALATFVALSVASGCAPTEPSARDDLARARARWSAMGSASYQVSIQRSCYCPETAPVRITVVNGTITSIQNLNTSAMLDPSVLDIFNTIDEAFAWIEDSLARRPSEFSALYDPILGYPLDVNIDFVHAAVDDEIQLRMWAFSPG